MESHGPKKQITYAIIPREEAKTRTGYELLKAIVDGELPGAPMARTLQFQLVELERGRVVFSGVPTLDFYNPVGSVHGGYAATLLDSCMGCAIHSTLPAGIGYTTLEFKISFIRPLTQTTGRVWAEGKLISAGKRVATAEGRLYDAEKRLYAHGTTTGLVFPL